MSRTSLPLTLQMVLKQHVLSADIQDDEELKDIINKLTELNNKLEDIKTIARQKRGQRS